jgi:hypothetical protein
MPSGRRILMTTSSKKSKGTHKMDVNMYMSTMDVETIMYAMRRSLSTKRRREWSRQLNDSSEKYR